MHPRHAQAPLHLDVYCCIRVCCSDVKRLQRSPRYFALYCSIRDCCSDVKRFYKRRESYAPARPLHGRSASERSPPGREPQRLRRLFSAPSSRELLQEKSHACCERTPNSLCRGRFEHTLATHHAKHSKSTRRVGLDRLVDGRNDDGARSDDRRNEADEDPEDPVVLVEHAGRQRLSATRTLHLTSLLSSLRPIMR